MPETADASKLRLLSHNDLNGFGNGGEGLALQQLPDGRRVLYMAHERAPKGFTAIDVTDPGWADAPGVADGKVVAVLAVNLIHIAPWQACCGLMEGAARLLGPGSVLYLYGAYRVDGATAPSNQAFDRMLRAHDPAWGVRDLESVARVAETHGFALAEAVAMPSNNLSAFFSRRG